MSETAVVTPSKSALRFIREMKAEKRDLKGIDKNDKALAEMSEMPGWQDLKEYINNLKESLKPQLDIKSSSDDEMFKSYGMRMMLYETFTDFADNIIRRVEDAKQEVRENT